MNFKFLILTIVMVSLALGTQAQKYRAGVKGGFNFSTLYVDDVEDQKIRPGLHVGFFGQSKLIEPLAIQTELLFSTAGNRSTYNVGPFDGEVKFNLNYLQLPVLLNLKILDLVEIHAGPYAAYLINTNISTDGDFGSDTEDLDKDNFKPLDFGAVVGAGINISAVQVGLRYNLGLTEIADSLEARQLLGESKNVVGQIYVAIGF